MTIIVLPEALGKGLLQESDYHLTRPPIQQGYN